MPPSVAPPGFIGRDRQLHFLDEDGRRAHGGAVRAVLVCGDAGIGKTRLIREYTKRTPMTDTVVGGCLELGVDGIPFAPFTAVLRHLAREKGTPLSSHRTRELARLVPELGEPPDPADESRARLFESVLTFLEECAQPSGLTLVLEDLQWADASTRDLLVYLLRNLKYVPIHLLLSVRTDDLHRTHPLRRLLPELERLPRLTRIDVEPFSWDEVAAQAAGLRGTELDPADVGLLHERTGGNPLFVESFLASADPAGAPIPEGPRDLLLAAVEALPETTRQVLGLAAAAGERVDHALLAAVARRAGITEGTLDSTLRQAIDAQVLRTSHDGYRFRHALLAEAVYTDLLPGERVRAHMRYAEALERGVPGRTVDTADTAAVQLAHHAYAARDQPLALTAAWRAADHLARTAAYPEHLALLERVLELWDRVPGAAELIGEPRGEVLRQASAVSLVAGSPRRAVDYATDGLREIGVTAYHDPHGPMPEAPALVAGLRHARARALKELGRDGALEDLADAAIVLPKDHPLNAAVGATLASTLMVRGHRAQAERSARLALERSRRANDRRSEADVLVTLGALVDAKDYDRNVELLAQGIEAARDCEHVLAELRGLVNLGGVLGGLGRFDESARALTRGLERCAELGLTRSQGGEFYYSIAAFLMVQGRLDEAEAMLPRVSGTPLIEARARSLTMVLALFRWDPERFYAARQEFGQLLPECSSSPREHAPVRILSLRAALAERRLAEAFDIALSLLDRVTGDHGEITDNPFVSALPAVAAAVGVLREEPGWEEEAADLITGIRTEFDRYPKDTTHPLDLLAHPHVTGAVGQDPQRALADIEYGVGLARRLGKVINQADMLVVAARVALRAEDRDRAHTHLAEAQALADRYGLGLTTVEVRQVSVRHGLPLPTAAVATDAARQRAEITGSGGATIAPAAGDGGDTGGDAATAANADGNSEAFPAGLTRRETEVLAELARGHTNREIGKKLFISAKTVSVHVTNLMGKLGVTNRNAAAVRARELGVG